MAGTVTLGGTRVVARGVFRGEFMELAWSQPRPPVAARLVLAGLDDATRALREFGKQLAKVGALWRKSWDGVLEEQAALDDFIAHGGNPAFIERVERAYGVSHS